MAVREGAAGHQRGDDRHPGHLREHLQLLRRVGPDDAAADVQDGAAGLEDQPGRLTDLLGVRAGHRAVAGQQQLGGPRERGLPLHRVLGHVDQHRAGAAGRGDVERLGDRARDLGGVGDQEVVLRDRHRDAADVGLLEGVGADRRAGDLAGDRDHRDRVHVGVRDRRDEVRRAGTAGRHADADLAGRRGVALGGVARALLVPDQDVPDLDRVVERVVRREDRAARDAEDVLGARALQGPDQALGARNRCPAALLAHRDLPLVPLVLCHKKTPRPGGQTRGRRGCVDRFGEPVLNDRVGCVQECRNAWGNRLRCRLPRQASVTAVS